MSTVIGGLTLDEDMVWTDEYKVSPVISSSFRTVGGGVIVQEFVRDTSGTPVTLESADGFGFQKKSTVEALKALAAIPEISYPLSVEFEGLTKTETVRFVNEQSGGAVQFEPIFPHEGLRTAVTWYQGKIYLETV